MNLLEKTNNINKHNCFIEVSEEKQGHLNVCKVICDSNKRKNKWIHFFPSVYQGYAMLHAKYLFDLPGKVFIVYQINEHSKGGHVEYEMPITGYKMAMF